MGDTVKGSAFVLKIRFLLYKCTDCRWLDGHSVIDGQFYVDILLYLHNERRLP
ncbi:hypothetical protein SAMN05421858_2022 [Haladaptatus litoreus]|uniref:Uncharacterized protein n=1 Tax=Haladaptatus litoreus TaxID=553468 RepID=A0A1N6ZGR6_9EURY|nr:hypothetical protein SAMN05421858_2022 [Haladaptatus litoreus]